MTTSYYDWLIWVGIMCLLLIWVSTFRVQVGGKLRALKKHIEALETNSLFGGTDFKLASCREPLNDQVAKECGFTSLSIRIVKVVRILLQLFGVFIGWNLYIAICKKSKDHCKEVQCKHFQKLVNGFSYCLIGE